MTFDELSPKQQNLVDEIQEATRYGLLPDLLEELEASDADPGDKAAVRRFLAATEPAGEAGR